MLKPDYPQALPMASLEAVGRLLSEEVIGVLGTHDLNGGIHVAPIYFLYEDGIFVMGTQAPSRKVRNLRHDPRATFLVERRTDPYRSVTAYGETELVTGEGVLERRIRILERLLSPSEAEALARSLDERWGVVEIRLRPDRLVTVDYGE